MSTEANSTDKVSVVIPAKDRAKEIGYCLDSVFNQALKPHEVIVVDDGSTDNTSAFIRENYPEVVLINNEQPKGGAVARNQGAVVATGEFLAFLDSDDEFKTDHLKARTTFIKANELDGAFGPFYLNDGETETEVDFSGPVISENLGSHLLGNTRFDTRTSTFVFKREPFLNIQFDEALKKHQDWDLSICFAEKYRFGFHNHPSSILHIQSSERMSFGLNFDSSEYFVGKNHSKVSANAMLMFCIKMAFRSQRNGEKDYSKYLKLTRPFKSRLSFSNSFLLKLLNTGLVTPKLLYRLRSTFELSK